ncbi:MAG: error-prone DNA polymerase, partial [Bdellovibrionales bacterium]|nr:error-prone DNA polymerase [Bdellovibrionales bacterium]
HENMQRAWALNYSSICINDYDGVYGLARSFLDLQRLKQERFSSENKKSLRLNYSVEFHLQRDHDQPLLTQNTVCVVAKNKIGYQSLCQLVSLSHKESKKEAILSLEQLLSVSPTGLAVIQPMRGIVRQYESEKRGQQKSKQEVQRYHDLSDHFNGAFYLALSRHLHPSEDFVLKKVLSFIKKYGFKSLCCQDAFMHRPDRKPLSDLLQAIRINKTLSQSEGYFFPNGERHLHSLHFLDQLYSPLPCYEQSLIYAKDLNEECSFDLSELRYQYPKEMIPKSYTAQEYLEKLAWEGAQWRYPQGVENKVKHLIHHELRLIKDLGFADYFLTVWDIVRWARQQNILCQGRGSAANSVVCFALGITAVDPHRFDLLFERFMSKERGDPPDIDVDFEHERREEVIQYIYQRYGREKAAMVANVITFRGKGALRSVGLALGVSEKVLSRVSHLRGTKFYRSTGIENLLSKTKMELSENSKDQLSEQIPWKLWISLSQELQGFPRHLGIHSGGFMISQDSIDSLVPREPATMEGRTVVQWCKEDIEGLGFFKIDLLCLGMLTAIRKSFHMIQQHYGKNLTLYNLPENDQKTYQMIQRADTAGVFQIESRAQMSMLPRLRPRCFYDLVIEVAIIRPGPIQGGVIHPFLRRRYKLEPVTYADPRLEPILKNTLGIPIFQEQAMRIAMVLGDFTPGEANELRKNIGAWNVKEFERNLNPWIEKLCRGMRNNNIDEKFIELLKGQMQGFSAYGFPESHAVSFALLAYASSYLKCHYPAIFFTALLNSQPMGFYPPYELLQVAQRSGVEVLPVCVNNSFSDHTIEGSQKSIRLGFRLVNGLSQEGAERLTSMRIKRGVFKSKEDFLQRTQLYRSDITALAAADAFRVFGVERKESLWWGEKVPLSPFIDVLESPFEWRKESSFEKIQSDYASFNASLGEHPASVIKRELWSYLISLKQMTSSHQFSKVQQGYFIYTFGMVLAKQAPPSAKGMVFLTLVDEQGSINLVFTPQIYERFHHLIDGEAFLCVYGKMQKIGSGHSLLVKKVFERQMQAKQYGYTPKADEKRVEGKEDVYLKKPRAYM